MGHSSVFQDLGTSSLRCACRDPATDVVWEFPASKAIPWAGTFTGPGEVGRFFPAVMECSEPQAFEPLHFVAADDRVVVLGRERFRVKSTA